MKSYEIIILILLNLIASKAAIHSPIFNIKHKIEFSKAYEPNQVFESMYRIELIKNISFLKCLHYCLSKQSCISIIFTKFNGSFSSCSTFTILPVLNVDLSLTNSLVIYQRILFKETASTKSTTNGYSSILSSQSTSSQIRLAFEGSKRFTLARHSSKVSGLDLLSNGDLVSVSYDQTINVWDISNGALKRTLNTNPGLINALVVLYNGDLASGGDDRKVSIWSINNKVPKLTISCNYQVVNALAALENDYVASGLTDNSIMISNTNNGSLVAILTGHSQPVTSFVVNDDGDLISGSLDSTIRIWSVNNFSSKLKLTGTSSIASLALLQNGFLAAGLYDNTIMIWDLKSSSNLIKFAAHNGWVNSISVLNDGRLASITSNELKIWNTTDWKMTKTLTFTSPDNLWKLKTLSSGELACASDKNIYIYS